MVEYVREWREVAVRGGRKKRGYGGRTRRRMEKEIEDVGKWPEGGGRYPWSWETV